MAFGLQPPIDLEDISGVWFQQIGQHMRSLICVGTSAILWSIWLCRNDVTFDKKDYTLICRLFSGQLIRLVSETSYKRRATDHM